MAERFADHAIDGYGGHLRLCTDPGGTTLVRERIIIVAIVSLLMFVFVPMQSHAEEANTFPVVPVGDWVCYAPSAKNGTYQYYYPPTNYLTPATPLMSPGQRVLFDSNTFQERGWSPWHSWTTASDYNRNEWYVDDTFNLTLYPWFCNTIPTNGTATIDYVFLIAIFNSAAPQINLSYSVDGGATYKNSTGLFGTGGGVPPVFRAFNVTSLEAWTANMLMSSQFLVNMTIIHTGGSETFYIDYLGFIAYYHVTWGGGAPGPGWQPPESSEPQDYDIGIVSGEGVLRAMGFIGFIGMIAVPPMAILAWRHQEDSRMKLFVGAIASFMFCLTMFLISIAS